MGRSFACTEHVWVIVDLADCSADEEADDVRLRYGIHFRLHEIRHELAPLIWKCIALSGMGICEAKQQGSKASGNNNSTKYKQCAMLFQKRHYFCSG